MDFLFRIRTQDGQIIPFVSLCADDLQDAAAKLRRQYPNCTILNCDI